MMHTLDTDLNTDNVIVLDPEGNLSLSLVKDAYEKFGIQVQHRSKASMKHNKYSKHK
jgi:Trm5-related predicted tRNA methylase